MNIDSEKFESEYRFLDNKKGEKRLLYILAGYKPRLWEIVFARVKEFCPTDVDVCVISSGLYSEKLDEYCQKYNWSYLSTKINKLTIAQNIVLRIFENAEWIFKMDEDVFVTDGFWHILENSYKEMEKKYRIGYVGPLVPISIYGLYRYLDIKGKLGEWKEYAPQFSQCKIGGDLCIAENQELYSDEIADYIWDLCEQIDDEAATFQKMKFDPEIIGTRFPICAIMFKRKLWERMGGFEIGEGNGGGFDEEQIISFCAIHSFHVICTPSSICYHFGFLYQEHILYRKYRLFKDKFAIKK